MKEFDSMKLSCSEFLEKVKKLPSSYTRAERALICAHADNCESCRDIADSKIFPELTPEETKEEVELIAGDLADSEYLEVRFGKGGM